MKLISPPSNPFSTNAIMATHFSEQKNWVETIDNIAALEAKKDVDTAAFIEGTDEEKKLVRKIDLFLMPTIWVLYCFSYMDRTNIVSKLHACPHWNERVFLGYRHLSHSYDKV